MNCIMLRGQASEVKKKKIESEQVKIIKI